MADSDITRLSIYQLSHYIKSREISPVEVLTSYIDRIESIEPLVNAFITPMFENGLKKARESEQKIVNKEYSGPLHGIPIGLKDLFWTKDTLTTSGSFLENGFIPQENSTVADLIDDAGAYCLGKLHMTEFAFDGTSLNKHFGPAKNPWNLDHMAGGSSSGPGVVIASRQLPLAIGTDTGGSVRVPASLCGVTGVKPTFGLISRFGATPLSWSMDHVGPLARTVRDAAISLNALIRFDPKDPYSIISQVSDYTEGLDKGVKGLRIGIPRDFVWDIIDPEVELAFTSSMKQMEGLGATIEEIVIPDLGLINMAGSVVQTSEAATIHREQVLENGDYFDPVIRMRIETGMFIPAESYIHAQQIRMEHKLKLLQTFDNIDVLATPTTAIAAPKLDQERINISNQDVHIREALLRITRIFSTLGFPAISVPCGFTKNHLPIGLQFVARPLAEKLMLRVAYGYQESTKWHTYSPDI